MQIANTNTCCMAAATYEKLFYCCKIGDLCGLEKLFKVRDVDINVRDTWDSTPLYYACLCGHENIVEFLLQNGAKCKATSFDGERCLYGALTNKIRNILKNWKQINAVTMRRENYFEFMRKMLNSQSHKDIIFDIYGDKFACHRCVLSARSKYFAQMFAQERWQQKTTVHFRNERIRKSAFEKFLMYMYCGVVDIKMEDIEDVKFLAHRFHVDCLVQEVDLLIQKMEKYGRLKPNVSQRVKIVSIEGPHSSSELRQDMWRFAQQLIPLDMRDWIEGVLPFPNNHTISHNFADLCIVVDGKHFMCHKAFMCTKSSYFEALLANHFNENSTLPQSQMIPVITLHNISPVVFKLILIYIYSETFEVKSFEMAYEILVKSDMMLLKDLKRLCGAVMGNYIDEINVFDIYSCSQLFQLSRLEDHCTEFFAMNIESMVENDDFVSLVETEAYSVKKREEADSIPVIDDIRYHITSQLSSVGQIEEAHEKLLLIDLLLDKLGIEG